MIIPKNTALTKACIRDKAATPDFIARDISATLTRDIPRHFRDTAKSLILLPATFRDTRTPCPRHCPRHPSFSPYRGKGKSARGIALGLPQPRHGNQTPRAGDAGHKAGELNQFHLGQIRHRFAFENRNGFAFGGAP